jgi:hypothetical protein
MKPVAWYDPSNGVVSTDKDSPLFTSLGQVWPLYPEREWVGLTDKEYTKLWGMKPDLLNFFRKIEAKLKEKNNG